MDYNSKIAAIIKYYSKIEIDNIENLIYIPKDSKYGDYSFPCYTISKYLNKSPHIIAEEMKKSICDKSFEKVVSSGPHLNFYINKLDFIENSIKSIIRKEELNRYKNIKKEESVCIEYSCTNKENNISIGILFNTAVGNSLQRIYRYLGYNTISINCLKKSEIKEKQVQKAKDNMKSILNVYDELDVEFDFIIDIEHYKNKNIELLKTLKNKELISVENGAQIVNLKEYNLPPLIFINKKELICNTRYICDYIYKSKNYNFSKIIYVESNNKNIRFKQSLAVLKMLGYGDADLFNIVSLGNIKINQSNFENCRDNFITVEQILQECRKRGIKLINETDLKVDEYGKLNLGLNFLIFEFLNNLSKKDVNLDLDNLFTGDSDIYNVFFIYYYSKSFLEKAGVISLEKVNYSKLVNDENIKFIKILNEFYFNLQLCAEQLEPYILANYIIKLSAEIRKIHKLSRDYEKTILINIAFEILNTGLYLLGIKL